VLKERAPPDVSFCCFSWERVKNTGTNPIGLRTTVKASKKSMLIVDDQRMVSDALRMILTFDGYEVQSAENGREALAIFEIGKFDLVFTQRCLLR
jgi:PleD family two-component response regulator